MGAIKMKKSRNNATFYAFLILKIFKCSLKVPFKGYLKGLTEFCYSFLCFIYNFVGLGRIRIQNPDPKLQNSGAGSGSELF